MSMSWTFQEVYENGGGSEKFQGGVEIGGTYKEENVFTQSGLVRNIF